MQAIRNSFHRTPCPPDGKRYYDFEEKFSFEPTDDQIACFQAIKDDMIHRTRPMDRLICGDVGFGIRTISQIPLELKVIFTGAIRT